MVIGNVLLIVLIMFSFPVAEKVRDLFESVNLPHHVKMVKGLEKIFRVLLVMSFFTLIIELCITEKSVLWQDLSLNATLLIKTFTNIRTICISTLNNSIKFRRS